MPHLSPALWLTWLAAALLPLWAVAQTAPHSTGGLGQLARQKEAMVGRLLMESPLARRILESDVAEAQRLLDEARTHHVEAKRALDAGQDEAANASLDAAMRAMHEARKLLPQSATALPDARTRYDAVLASTLSLREGFVARLSAQAQDVDSLSLVDGLIDESRSYAAAGRYAPAMESLGKAEKLLSTAHKALVGDQTLEYRKQFDSPEQVFLDAMARNSSFADLVPVAIAQLKPDAAMIERLNAAVLASREARKQASESARIGRYDAATLMIDDATRVIEERLAEAGLSLTRAARE